MVRSIQISAAYRDLPPKMDGAEATAECPDLTRVAKTDLKLYG